MVNDIYCPNCRTKISESDVTCSNCGFKQILDSKNSTFLNLDLKKILSIFTIGVIAYLLLSEFISPFAGLLFSNNLSNFNNSNLINNDLLDFFLELVFIFFLYFLILFYQGFSDKRQLTNFLLKIALIVGTSFGITFLINNFITAPFLKSQKGLGITFSILSLPDFINNLLLGIVVNSLSITLTVLFVIFLHNKSYNKYRTGHRYYLEFICFALIFGVCYIFITYEFNTNDPALDLILSLIFAFICSKFLPESIDINNKKQYFSYSILVFIFIILGIIIGEILFEIISEPFYTLKDIETFVLGNFSYPIITNLILSINLTIEFFAFLFLIQVYNSKIDLVKSNQPTSTSNNN